MGDQNKYSNIYHNKNFSTYYKATHTSVRVYVRVILYITHYIYSIYILECKN